jgi:uncharacterized LabA/DUF88 family protein
MFYRDERLALFIDGSNLYAAAKALSFDIDYKLLRQEFMQRGKLLRAFLLHCPAGKRRLFADPSAGGLAALQRLHHGDQTGQGIHRRQRPPQGEGQHGYRADGRCHGTAPHVDHIVLFSGDGDFRPLVEALQRKGVRVSVVSTIRSQPPMIADDLRRQADNFIELEELKDVIGRPPREPRYERVSEDQETVEN